MAEVADVRGDYRGTTGQGLQSHQPEALVMGRDHTDVSRIVEVRHQFVSDRAREDQ